MIDEQATSVSSNPFKKVPMTSQEALQHYNEHLTKMEKLEILL